MSEGEPGAVGGSVPDKAEQADAPVPQVSFNQFNQQILLRDRPLGPSGTLDCMSATGFYREVDIPDDFGDGSAAPATGRVVLPSHVAWSGQGELDLDDPADRSYAYEILLAEGTANDVRAYVDVKLLIEAWDDLHLAPHVRDQWGEWLRARGVIV